MAERAGSGAGRITRRSALRRAGGAAALFILDRAYGRPGEAAAPGEAVPTGAVRVHRITEGPLAVSNIYCEFPFSSRSSRLLLYERTEPGLPGDKVELMAVEPGTWKQHRLDVASGIEGLTVTPDGILYYMKGAGKGERHLMRVDLDGGTPERVYTWADMGPILSLGTVSADGRHYATGVRAARDWSSFGIALVDLAKGERTIVDRDPFILNPHPQFDPGDRRRLLIQHNRGGRYAPDGRLERLVGDEGATLYALSVPGGKRTELRVGKPHTAPCTGHETWIGTTGEVLLSVEASGDNTPEKGNLLAARPGGAPRVVLKGHRTNHVGVSRCGRFYTCDDWQPPFRVIAGSFRTGRSVALCETGTRPGEAAGTHPHPYLTPDLKWLIYNSNREGAPAVYAAELPEGLIAGLEKA